MEPGTVEARAARFSDRVVAYLIDTVPLGAAAGGVAWAALGPLGKAPTPELLALIGAGWFTALFGYQLIGNMNGGTLGKRLLGLRVVARDGTAPGFVACFVRAAVWMLGSSTGCAGFLVALFNRENRALHDYASGTVVIEAYQKTAAEGTALFLAGALGAVGLIGYQLYSGYAQPTRHDRAAVAKAEAGLEVIAQVEEAYKAKHGVYATSIEQLADVSGDPVQFRVAMAALFMPEPFKMEAGNRGWRIRAAARDRARTPIVKEGP